MKRLTIALLAAALITSAPSAVAVQAVGNGGTSCPTVGSGTFANRPASAGTCSHYFATDLGTGADLVWSGSIWKPATGVAVLGQSGIATPLTGTTGETNIASISIPAGLLSANGSLRITTAWSYSNNANNKTLLVRYGTAVGTAGTIFQNSIVTTNLTTRWQAQIQNANSTSAQTGPNASLPGFGNASGTVTSAFATGTTQTFISLNGNLAVGTDSIALISYTVEWVEP